MAKTYENSKGQIFNSQAEAAASNTALGTNPTAKNINVGAIPVDTLNTSASPYKLQPTSTPSDGGLEAAIGSIITTTKSRQEQDLEQLRNQKDTSVKDYLDELVNSSKISSSIDRTSQDAAKVKSDEYTAQLEQEQLANRRNIESLQKNNPQGMFGGGLQQEVERLNRESLSKQADIAILQAAANRNYDTAKEIADRQLQMKLDESKVKLDALKFFYEENKADFNKADERLYNETIKKADREYEKQKDIEETLRDMKVEAVKGGAGANILKSLSEIDTSKPGAFDELLAIGAPYFATAENDIIEVNGNKLLVNKRTGAVVKNFGGGTGGSLGIVQRTVNGSPVDGYKLVAGDDPYFIAQKYGTDINGLKALNPKITDWNNIPAGATINVPSIKAAQTSALQTILGSNKFTKDQVALVANSINNGQDPLVVIKNQARDIMGTEGTATLKLESAKTAMQELDKNLKAYYAAGGTSGLFQGGIEKFENRLGTVKNPALVALATKINTSIQKYRNAVSGTAYSVQEGKDIASVFPGIQKGELLNNTIIAARLDSFDSDIDGNYRNVLGSAYDSLKASTKTPTDPIQNIKAAGDANPALRPTLIQMQADGRTIEEINTWLIQNNLI